MRTDEEIIGLFFARSEEAVEAAAQRYGGRLRALAIHILKDPRDAEESVSDTYLAAWNTIPPQHPDPLGAYLCRIARNIAVTKYHRNKAQRRDSSYDAALDELEECLAAPEGVEDAISAGELTKSLDRFLAGLDRERRVLFVRRYWYGESVEELARRFACTPNTVSARLLRLRKKLRSQLEKEGFL